MGVCATPRLIFLRTSTLDSNTMDLDTSVENLDSSLARNIPDAEIMIQPVSSFERHVPGHSLITLYPTIVQPVSRGRIELASTDPFANPRIFHPMLEDSRDLVPFRKAIRFTMRLAEEFAERSGYPYPATLTFAPGVNGHLLDEWEKTAPVVNPDGTGTTPAAAGYTFASKAGDTRSEVRQVSGDGDTVVAKTWKTVTDDEIDDYIRRVGMGSMHVASSCPMSRDGKAGGVVDQKLRVHGIKNLRVADASVFPMVPSCHTMAPTIMVAERCADFVKGAWGE